MVKRCSPIFLVAVLLLLSFSKVGAASPVSFEIVASFDYPDVSSTQAYGLNDLDQVVGRVFTVDDLNETRGFVRFRDGHFSPPIQVPFLAGNGTAISGINNLADYCGTYANGSHYHGFLWQGGVYTSFDIPGSAWTYVNGLNDAGNFCGDSADAVTDDRTAFVSIDGVVTSFPVADADFVEAFAINNLNQCVGRYQTGTGFGAGFVRQPDGTLIYPISALGATYTWLSGIDDRGRMVGAVADQSGGIQGVFFKSLNHSATFAYPGAAVTFFTGINSHGLICGWYQDSVSYNIHSFLVKVRGATED